MGGRDSRIAVEHLEGVYSLLDQLQAGFVLVAPDGTIRHANYWARRLFKRRALQGHAREWLGSAVFAEICAPVLDGASAGERWRELELEGREAGVAIDVSIRSTAVDIESEGVGVLLSMHDISGEVGLHRQNKKLLEKQKQINANLRREIAAKLREHEDDISQFSEILQVAPSIFASFLTEAESTIDTVDRVLESGPDAESVVEALRCVHTLKGNARSLGLNFIGGRAHGVEDLLEQMRKQGELAPDALPALRELADDLRRARDRASFVRSRLGDTASVSSLDVDRYRILGEVQDEVAAALASLPPDSPARGSLERAVAHLGEACNAALQELFEYVKATVASTARSVGQDCPEVHSRGGGIAVPARVYRALAEALPHLARNAVTHGIESAEDRLDAGKSATGVLEIAAELRGDDLVVCLADDGRGLDLERLGSLAEDLGMARPTDAETLAALLLSPGVSTADAVTIDRGRGMGTSAAREAVEALGGTIAVETERDRGTRFTLRLPLR